MKQSFTPTDENGYFHSRQNSNSEMNQEVLLKRVKQAVHEVEPDAQIILYGSRSRKEATPGSDWDFLVLVDGPVSDEHADVIRHLLYEIEWECGEVLCAVVGSRQEWDSPLYQAMPFRQNVERA
jgi:predicted nucleotidyltransferase